MMNITHHETGSKTDGTVGPVYLDSGCPRCGMCAECREEALQTMRRDHGIDRALARGEYRRGLWNGATVTLVLGSIAALVLVLAWEVYGF